MAFSLYHVDILYETKIHRKLYFLTIFVKLSESYERADMFCVSEGIKIVGKFDKLIKHGYKTSAISNQAFVVALAFTVFSVFTDVSVLVSVSVFFNVSTHGNAGAGAGVGGTSTAMVEFFSQIT